MPENAQLLILDKNAVEPLLEPAAVLDAVREAFVLHSHHEGRIFPVIREPLSTGGVFGIKAGDVQSQGLLGFKAAGFWPKNRNLGGEPHQATILLFDPATGRPTCMIDGNMITTLRTGAAGALGLKLLAREDSKTLCVFGSGVQARVQLEFALKTLPRLEKVSYLTVDQKPDSAFEAAFKTQPIMVAHSKNANAAVSESDVVITATPGKAVLFDLDAVNAGTHFNCVGADTKGKREVPAGLVEKARLFSDDKNQSVQIGEGQWSPEIQSTELGELLTHKISFDRKPGDITLFDMTGLALQDLTVARMLFERAKSSQTGKLIAWPW